MYTYEYPRPALTVDVIVYTKERAKDINEIIVLLIKRGKEPFKNKWALPGGFVEMDELLADACKRELKEETGVTVNELNQFKTYDAINRDPRHRTISVVFIAELENRAEAVGNDDAAEADWFSLSKLPELAFDHKKILDDFNHRFKINSRKP